jgi:hypothetical protein
VSHDLKAFEQLLTKERDEERERYTVAVAREKAGDTIATYQRGIAFGAATSYELALDVLHTFTDGEFGQKLAQQKAVSR